MQPQKLVGPIVIKISNSNIYLFMSRHDVNVGLDFCTAIAILQIKCATLVHVSVPERQQETFSTDTCTSVSCKRSGTDTCTSVAHLICKIAIAVL